MYRLDDTIKASVTLVSNGSVTVRWASLNLLAQTRLTEVRMGKSIKVGIGDFLYPSDHVRLEDTKHTPMQRFMQVKTGTAVCYSTKFPSAASLRNGRPGTFDVELEVGPTCRISSWTRWNAGATPTTHSPSSGGGSRSRSMSFWDATSVCGKKWTSACPEEAPQVRTQCRQALDT